MSKLWLWRAFLGTPFAASIGCLLLIGWVAWLVVYEPYNGLTLSLRTGVVAAVDPVGPAHDLFQPGDVVQSIDGQPHDHALLYGDKSVGATVVYHVARNGSEFDRPVQLAPTPPPVLLSRLVPVVVALVFWIVSVVVLAFKPSGTQSRLFWLFSQTFSVTLLAGAIGVTDLYHDWPNKLFYTLIWWVGPLAINLHYFFPARLATRQTYKVLLALYGVAALGSVPTLLGNPLQLRISVPWLYPVSLLWFASCLLGVVYLLIQDYRRAPTAKVRRQLGLVAIGGSIACIPFFVLLLLPQALLQQPILPDAIPFLFMLAIPLTYGYAIINYQLIRLDRYISRAAAYTLVVTVLVGLFIVLHVGLRQVVPATMWEQQSSNLMIALILAAVPGVLYRRLQRGVNYMFYGGTYDYQSAVRLVSQKLAQPSDSITLAQTLCESIRAAMHLEWVCLFVRDASQGLIVAGQTSNTRGLQQLQTRLAETDTLYQFFQTHPELIASADLRRWLAETSLSPSEQALLEYEAAGLWVPLCTTQRLVGLCIVGSKPGSETFDPIDLDILAVITRLATTALQNTQLLTEVRGRIAEIEQLHQRVLTTREEERKRVARDLHDQIIQSLIGINHHLSNLRRNCEPQVGEQIVELQGDVRQTLDDVRHICADLRPPALDNLGIVPAVRARLRDLERQTGVQVALTVEGDDQMDVPEAVAVCIYRVLQEAVMNAQKHAQAQHMGVGLRFEPTGIGLSVQDDGVGFQMPEQLGHLMQGQHFGLVGLRERVELVKGTIHITSTVGHGTRIQAWVPLEAEQMPMLYDQPASIRLHSAV